MTTHDDPWRSIWLDTLDGAVVPFAECSREDLLFAQADLEHAAFCAASDEEREAYLRSAAAMLRAIEELWG